MKPIDIPVFLLIILGAAVFIYPPTLRQYQILYQSHPILLSFIKFALLATFGEMLIHRIKKGSYYHKNFGLFPKMVIWGLLGVMIYFALGIFSLGVSRLFFKTIALDRFVFKLTNAFLISLFMNIIFAPLMMLSHRVTDMHIEANKGRFPWRTFSPLQQLSRMNWQSMWGFVIKKTIPFFWIPAHTITFLLPEYLRVLFAAILSLFLGIILAFAKK